MPGLSIPFALVQARRNPVRTPVRNLSITQGDATVLDLSCHESETGGPLDLTGAAVHIALYREPGAVGRHGWSGGDYGWHGGGAGGVYWQGRGEVTQSLLGRAEIDLPGELTAGWCAGRYAFDLRVDTGRGGVTQARGVLQVLESAFRQPVRPALFPVRVHDALYGEFEFPVVDCEDGGVTDPGAGPLPGTPASSILGLGVLGVMILGRSSGSNSAGSSELGVGRLGSMILPD